MSDNKDDTPVTLINNKITAVAGAYDKVSGNLGIVLMLNDGTRVWCPMAILELVKLVKSIGKACEMQEDTEELESNLDLN
jgi:hypothetical protein